MPAPVPQEAPQLIPTLQPENAPSCHLTEAARFGGLESRVTAQNAPPTTCHVSSPYSSPFFISSSGDPSGRGRRARLRPGPSGASPSAPEEGPGQGRNMSCVCTLGALASVLCFSVCEARAQINHFRVKDLVAFSTFAVSCSCHLCPVPELSHHPRRNVTPSPVPRHRPTAPDLPSVSVDVSTADASHEWVAQYVAAVSGLFH